MSDELGYPPPYIAPNVKLKDIPKIAKSLEYLFTLFFFDLFQSLTVYFEIVKLSARSKTM